MDGIPSLPEEDILQRNAAGKSTKRSNLRKTFGVQINADWRCFTQKQIVRLSEPSRLPRNQSQLRSKLQTPSDRWTTRPVNVAEPIAALHNTNLKYRPSSRYGR